MRWFCALLRQRVQRRSAGSRLLEQPGGGEHDGRVTARWRGSPTAPAPGSATPSSGTCSSSTRRAGKSLPPCPPTLTPPSFRTPFRRPPVLGGREVDLHLLYTLVTGQGGWIKVRAPCARRAGGADAAPPTAPCRLHQGGKVRVGSSTTRADRSRSPPPGSRHYAN